MNKEYKLDECQIQKQLQTFNSFITLHTIIKVSSFLKEYNLFLTEIIGCGAFGVVFKSYDDYNSRDVAIKIMINQNTQKKKELEEEIKILRKIKSEFVIKIYEHLYDEESSCFMIVMEYCQHGDLHSYFNNKQGLEKEEIIRLFTHFLVGLQDIHSQNIIHSDLKPQNILLAQNYKIKICDLGLSKILSNNQSFTSNKGGTFIYSSKEQSYGQVRLESDYYSAGAILCFLCGLEIESNLMMACQLKDGIFPDINNKKYKELIEIGFQMMQIDHQKRMKPKIACERLNELKNNNNEITRSQRESQTDKEIKNGKWIYFWNNGDKYEGEWKNDKMNGSGIYLWKSGERYEGEFKDDVKSGQATLYFENGDKYVGQYQNDKRNGYGIKYFLKGDKYEGEYKDNNFSGQGTYYWANGNKYVGNRENDKMNGYGVYYYANGNRYEGEFKDGLYSGQGSYYWISGDRYVGKWENDKKNGYGVNYYRNGDRYEGEWKDDQRSGQASYYLSTGDKYVGMYLNDKKIGEGTYYKKDGRQQQIFFKDNILQQQ